MVAANLLSSHGKRPGRCGSTRMDRSTEKHDDRVNGQIKAESHPGGVAPVCQRVPDLPNSIRDQGLGEWRSRVPRTAPSNQQMEPTAQKVNLDFGPSLLVAARRTGHRQLDRNTAIKRRKPSTPTASVPRSTPAVSSPDGSAPALPSRGDPGQQTKPKPTPGSDGPRSN